MNFSKDKLTSLLDPQWFRDFFAFKLNVFPIIVRFLYILAVVFCILYAIAMICQGHWLAGICSILLGPILLHLLLEFLLLPFAILDTLRDIRDKK